LRIFTSRPTADEPCHEQVFFIVAARVPAREQSQSKEGPLMDRVHAAPRSGLAVGFCTYKRPGGLVRLLQHLSVAVSPIAEPTTVIVVDNDGDDPEVSAIVSSFAESSALRVIYVVERTPGISAARNAVFEQVDALGIRFVAMIDDDEWPSPHWLVALLAACRQTKAVIVGGPVRPVFPEHATQLNELARYWSVMPQNLEGKTFVFCTCNFIADMNGLEDVKRPFFDDEYGLTGGGDTVFFRGLFYSGHDMAWAAEAVVYEEVPETRASLQWMRKRKFRQGNHAVRWEGVGKGRGAVLAKTLGLTCRLPIYPLLNREPESRLIGWLFELDKVRGRYAAHFGSDVVEYARPTATGREKACR
jgi:succinoglycan biosynthesis protein ExoM